MFSASFENIFFGPLFPSNLERTVRIQVLCLLLVIDEITLFFFFCHAKWLAGSYLGFDQGSNLPPWQ